MLDNEGEEKRLAVLKRRLEEMRKVVELYPKRDGKREMERDAVVYDTATFRGRVAPSYTLPLYAMLCYSGADVQKYRSPDPQTSIQHYQCTQAQYQRMFVVVVDAEGCSDIG
jgi:hypothetical protein